MTNIDKLTIATEEIVHKLQSYMSHHKKELTGDVSGYSKHPNSNAYDLVKICLGQLPELLKMAKNISNAEDTNKHIAAKLFSDEIPEIVMAYDIEHNVCTNVSIFRLLDLLAKMYAIKVMAGMSTAATNDLMSALYDSVKKASANIALMGRTIEVWSRCQKNQERRHEK